VARADALPDAAFADPSPLPGWTVADLVAHCARSVGALATALEGHGAPPIAGPAGSPEPPGLSGLPGLPGFAGFTGSAGSAGASRPAGLTRSARSAASARAARSTELGGSAGTGGPARTGGLAAAGASGDAVDYLGGVGARAEAVADIARADAAGLDPAEIRSRLRTAVAVSTRALDAALTGGAALGRGAALGGGAEPAEGGEPTDRPEPAASAEPVSGVLVPGVAAGPTPGVGGVLDAVISTPGGPLRLGDFVVTRIVEGVVHGLDLGVPPARDGLRIVVRALVDLLAARAPGRSVELRVPPFAAAQVIAGPRHTRGTPPNVVEADPVAFVAVASGRLDWATAVADGRISASGERADLRDHLPLL
jgi:hypothetical protein